MNPAADGGPPGTGGVGGPDWNELLVAACRGEGLSAAYQPIVDTARGIVVGYEALARFPGFAERNPEVWFAAARQHDAQVRREIAMMQLKLQAVEAGVTSLWEVTLYPDRGNNSPPQWVVVPGRDSRQATANALAQNLGFVAGPVRRIAPR